MPIPHTAFAARKKKNNIEIEIVSKKDFKSWFKKQSKIIQDLSKAHDFDLKGRNSHLIVRGKKDEIEKVIFLITDNWSLYDASNIARKCQNAISDQALKSHSFSLERGISKKDLNRFYLGWGLLGYGYSLAQDYKAPLCPILAWSPECDQEYVESVLNGITLLRDLINVPANLMGPEDLEKEARSLAKTYEAKISVIKDQKKLENDFPLIHTVGKASDRSPRLLDLKWGNAKHPKVTLVGKGVCFDTGGLDIKPSQYMRLMKKDMGGAAHVLGLASAIMATKLPINLRVLIPAVENSVSSNAFRPGDVIVSRKGLSVENTNTDAEGRLVLADALHYACEDKPELIIDFATLTGSARAALGHDIPAMFSNDAKIAQTLEDISFETEDPLWNMPLYQDYKKHITSPIADLVNSAGLPGDLIYSALFLQQFVNNKTPWVHIDCFAWEQSGQAGRPKGGADTGMRAVFSYLQNRYGRKG